MYYHYLYIDPSNDIPRYAGKGKNDRYKAYYHENKQFLGWIRKLKAKGVEPQIEITKTTCEFAALWLERVAIAAYGRLDMGTGTLFNHTDGGDNPPKMTSEAAKKSYQTQIRNGTYHAPTNRGRNPPKHFGNKFGLGRVFVHNELELKYILSSELDSYLKIGWKKGMGKFQTHKLTIGKTKGKTWYKDTISGKRVWVDKHGI